MVFVSVGVFACGFGVKEMWLCVLRVRLWCLDVFVCLGCDMLGGVSRIVVCVCCVCLRVGVVSRVCVL